MIEHTMHLKRIYFDMFLRGTKTIELRLLDEKRKKSNWVMRFVLFAMKMNPKVLS